MLKMTLCRDSDKIKKLCREWHVEYTDNVQLYCVSDLNKDGNESGYAFFQIADYEIELMRVVYDKSDPMLFDFIVKGVLSYGEQNLALRARFSNQEDTSILIRFGFIQDESQRVIKLYQTVSSCDHCKKSEK